MSSPLPRIHLTGLARRDIASIARYTLRAFGLAATERYDALIRQALRDIQEDPDRPGTKALLAISDFRFYHLSFSRERVVSER